MDIKADPNTVVCFDLDDTLYNELDYLKSAYLEIAKSISESNQGFRSLYATMLSLYFQKKDVFGYLCETFKCDKQTLIRNYRNHIPTITAFDGVATIFEKLKRRAYKIAIITDGRSTTQRQKLKSLSLYEQIDLFVISEEIGSEKPSLVNFQKVMETFKGGTFYYFGDNYKKDFITPNKLGWTTVALANNGKNIHQYDLTAIDPEYFPQELIFGFNEIKIL